MLESLARILDTHDLMGIDVGENKVNYHVISTAAENDQVKEVSGEITVLKKRDKVREFRFFDEDLKAKAFLGVRIVDGDRNVLVEEIIPGTGTEKEEIIAGDRIVSLDNEPTVHTKSLEYKVIQREPDQTVTVGIMREGKELKIEAVLGEHMFDLEREKIKFMRGKLHCKKMKSIREKVASIKFSSNDVTQLQEAAIIPDTEEEIVVPRSNLDLEDFTIFSNPSDGMINLSFVSNDSPVIVQITDVSGRTIYKQVDNEFTGKYQKQIDLTREGSGTFILYVIQDQKVKAEKLVLSK